MTDRDPPMIESDAAGPVSGITVRPVRASDYAGWRPLWDGYNAFYGRRGETALPESVTAATWERFLDPAEPVHALVAVREDQVAGLAHYLFHRSTTRLTDVCYLQDLFTAPAMRGLGIARRLIETVYDHARAAAATRVYWQTQETNRTARALYEKLAKHRGFIVYTHEL
ncbi:MAG TPA: GNAT family N-acetyltransferase [Steroidobacteraceae bacterium]|nr:GNAT family N-acetyltransferase [Steroidobacteraceae bacterium]